MTLHLLYYQATIIVPLFSFYIFQHINDHTYDSTSCIALVIAVALTKLIKPFLRVTAENRLRNIGQDMHNILCREILSKTFKVSLLSSQTVTYSELVKIMQVDM
jgi:ABC-type transport system involved in cytochrome bd biosynthesis fused ATPase/permease subunit